jgi:hypothetical protein
MYLSKGSKKLKGDSENQFIVWSIPALVTCPYSTQLCRKYCYAKKTERIYKRTRSARAQNLIDSMQDDFAERMIEAIKEKVQERKKVWVRIHEGGDFYSREYFQAWMSIARALPNIRFMAYTKSIDFIEAETIPNNVTLRFSIWADTMLDDIKKADELGLGTYTAVHKSEIDSTPHDFKCVNDCQKCKVCYHKDVKRIVNTIH